MYIYIYLPYSLTHFPLSIFIYNMHIYMIFFRTRAASQRVGVQNSRHREQNYQTNFGWSKGQASHKQVLCQAFLRRTWSSGMWIHIYIYIYIYIYIHAYMYITHACRSVYEYMYMSIYINVCIHLCGLSRSRSRYRSSSFLSQKLQYVNHTCIYSHTYILLMHNCICVHQ
jgi:hypothetical protein